MKSSKKINIDCDNPKNRTEKLKVELLMGELLNNIRITIDTFYSLHQKDEDLVPNVVLNCSMYLLGTSVSAMIETIDHKEQIPTFLELVKYTFNQHYKEWEKIYKKVKEK